ncbi:hypothetical protein CMI39_01450 [Candidatus Pacearchaeota archaeon]|nr:hypothetical protein [Candidatus Pacearchaeota archaeon]
MKRVEDKMVIGKECCGKHGLKGLGKFLEEDKKNTLFYNPILRVYSYDKTKIERNVNNSTKEEKDFPTFKQFSLWMRGYEKI